jgi:hypothetical protein
MCRWKIAALAGPLLNFWVGPGRSDLDRHKVRVHVHCTAMGSAAAELSAAGHQQFEHGTLTAPRFVGWKHQFVPICVNLN